MQKGPLRKATGKLEGKKKHKSIKRVTEILTGTICLPQTKTEVQNSKLFVSIIQRRSKNCICQ